MGRNAFVTTEMVRQYIWDRSVEDNELEMKLRFTDDEILNAMDTAARSFNSLPPVHIRVSFIRLPADTNMFVDATVAYLYSARLAKYEANDIDHSSGGVTVNLEKKQIEHMQTRVKYHMEEFRAAASAIKLAMNVAGAYGRVG